MTRTVGVQCKCVENFTFTQLTDEVKKAEGFAPPLESFIIALALPRDAVLQKQVFKLSLERAKAQKFRVGVWFWDDIAELMGKKILPSLLGTTLSFLATLPLLPRVPRAWWMALVGSGSLLTRSCGPIFTVGFFLTQDTPTMTGMTPLTRWRSISSTTVNSSTKCINGSGRYCPRTEISISALAAAAAQEGAFEIALADNAGVPDAARDSAEKVYDSLRRALEQLQTDLETFGVRFNAQ